MKILDRVGEVWEERLSFRTVIYLVVRTTLEGSSCHYVVELYGTSSFDARGFLYEYQLASPRMRRIA